MKKFKRELTFPKYISSIHKISKIMLHTGIWITLVELIAVGFCMISDTASSSPPLFAVYIPIIRFILVFCSLNLFFSLLFDTVYRKSNG